VLHTYVRYSTVIVLRKSFWSSSEEEEEEKKKKKKSVWTRGRIFLPLQKSPRGTTVLPLGGCYWCTSDI